MPHIRVLQARAVLADPENHPEVLRSYASSILKWHDGKRIAMQWLWKHHEILKLWIGAQQGKTRTERKRFATRKLSAKLSAEHLNDFHKAYNYMGNSQRDMGLMFATFDALLKTLNCPDVAMMHRYFACVSAERADLTLESVSFLRWGTHDGANEVLVWRLLRALSPAAPVTPSV